MGSVSSEDDGYEQHSDRCGSYSGLSADISESESSNSLSFRRIDTDGAASSSIASSPLAFRPVVGNCSFPGPGALVYPVIGGRDVVVWDDKTTHKHEDTTDVVSEIELMKERFAKLLLGEDMSGGGKGVCTALAISNAITNLAASVFGELWRLEPMPQQRKKMWCREMDWLLCVSDSIVELVPSIQDFPGGGTYEVMATRPRSDLYVNLPALKKLDAMLLGMLDGFKETEFSYVERGITVADTGSLDPLIQSSTYGGDGVRPSVGDKWWLPTPKVPPNGGLSENARKNLQQCKDCTNQILKAAVAINSGVLAEMEVPSAYLESLPKRGKDCLGDMIYRYITAERFSPECLPNCLDLSSEHHTLEIANRIEAAVHVWRLKDQRRATNHTKAKRTSWGGKVKGLVADQDKNQVLAQRAETLLRSLKLRFPSLPQTMLDMTKIQYNKDVGQAILESYSRVIESLAFNITARIDDLLYADDAAKHSVSSSGESKDKSLFSRNGLGNIPIQKRLSPSPFSIQHSPYASPFATPKLCLSPVSRSPARGSPHTADKNTQKGSSDDPKVAKLNTLDFERVWSCPGNLSSRKAGDVPERD